MSNFNTYISISDLGYALPHGEKLISNLSFTFSSPRLALVGANGVGKSTLARLMAQKMEPSEGSIITSGRVRYFDQMVSPPASGDVLSYLGEVWDLLGEDWSYEMLEEIQALPFEQDLRSLSGGEWMRVRLLHELSQAAESLILDEPSNHLDQRGREFLKVFLREYPGQIILISHDRELLQSMDHIVELTEKGIQSYSGGYAAFLENKSKQQEALQRDLERFKKEKKKSEKMSQEKLASQEKRMRKGQSVAAKGGIPRILAGGLKRRAQGTLAKKHIENQRIEADLSQELQKKLELQVRGDDFVLKGFESHFAEGKLVFELRDFNVCYGGQDLWTEGLHLTMRGPRRWRLGGENGSGKSSLIKSLLQPDPQRPFKGECQRGEVQIRMLDQNQSILTPGKTLLELMSDWWGLEQTEARNALALHQFTGHKVFRKSEELSGGERVKAALLALFYQEQDNLFLVLDEPTNNLDLTSIELLERALRLYKGPLLVVSHDPNFLQNIGIEDEINLVRKIDSNRKGSA